ncbi:MAG: sigma-54 dependent transcriptional regulator [Pseudodesulfovibrio sp.]|uniref:Sigma-54 factor interaction domain-containing protein n=1 Tax=Pseudodesulfovibrio aespoeensis (strain ATCC 700646 / DSM 10631 / Aspo-2) TaxID=643562 RepID=E6VWU4_PSEA9|nr:MULTISPECIES: sigma-54 dependent transcriptional regulator [Pseudodesulfovibrio]MBU4515448.1 sigma-54 dependent transcriptional regulator [Pseudomonadota bacterium]ADU63706.1 sigma-54 factor interaction domain-containing protein [Pseudodesulfovibrio aespoeensis Aspo-2]MBU4522342.1 sigma-54 dependent transcriptional regulator [Pseudomonadota bacterium]MBU4560368.1 sigma-54 dependent transcriptional regulator [Pseudomonadota bacterium]MBV1765804.1 sigma-54 dependent transcriptional regulator 
MRKYMIATPDNAAHDTLETILAPSGEGETFSDMAALRSALATRPVDVLFVDYGLLTEGGLSHRDGISAVWQGHQDVEIVILVQPDEIRRAVDAVKSGASDYLTYPVNAAEVQLVLERLDKNLILTTELDYLRDQFWNEEALRVVRTNSPAMREAFAKVRQMAGTKTTVLLTGETGTGKSLIAKLIHSHSVRRDAPFVSVHCGAIPDTLIESELFGHEKGAFTGAAKRKIGKFGLAEGGTMFLDEVGTISQPMQVKLLSVLQDKTIQRVGCDQDIPVDVRIIAATNDSLRDMCEKGFFRKDLYYRLNVFPIEIPPLRERKSDIFSFAEVFIRHFSSQLGKSIKGLHPKTLDAFQRYSWPGNVRELENLIERACILERSELITPDSIPQDLFAPGHGPVTGRTDISIPLGRARQNVVDAFERSYLAELLEATHGRIKDAAQWAGITPRQLHKLMSRHGLQRRDFRTQGKKVN